MALNSGKKEERIIDTSSSYRSTCLPIANSPEKHSIQPREEYLATRQGMEATPERESRCRKFELVHYLYDVSLFLVGDGCIQSFNVHGRAMPHASVRIKIPKLVLSAHRNQQDSRASKFCMTCKATVRRAPFITKPFVFSRERVQ